MNQATTILVLPSSELMGTSRFVVVCVWSGVGKEVVAASLNKLASKY